eukprot:sb/3478058/
MRQLYYPSPQATADFDRALDADLGVYHNQRGGGIGGFLKKLFRTVAPIGKTILQKGFEIAKPGLQTAGNELVNAAGQYAARQIETGANRLTNKIGKRKRDVLS